MGKKSHPYSSVFLLSCGIEDVDLAWLVVKHDLLAVRVCFGGVVFLHKVAIHVLKGQGRLADTTRADHDDLVQWQVLFSFLAHDADDEKKEVGFEGKGRKED